MGDAELVVGWWFRFGAVFWRMRLWMVKCAERQAWMVASWLTGSSFLRVSAEEGGERTAWTAVALDCFGIDDRCFSEGSLRQDHVVRSWCMMLGGIAGVGSGAALWFVCLI